MDQRRVPLDFTPTSQTVLEVTSPFDGWVAPPGYYMLFVVSDIGAPSIAAIVRLRQPSIGPPPPP